MTQVHVRLSNPDGSPAQGYVDCAPTRRFRSENKIVLPAPTRIILDQHGEAVLSLEPTTAHWVWKVQEYVPGGTRRYVAVPDQVSAEYADLVNVDPATLEPTAEPEAAWWAALMQVEHGGVSREVIEQAVDDALDEHVESPAPHPAYDEIPDLTLLFNNSLI